MSILTTPRLILREWRSDDLEPFAALNADPETMEFMAGCLTRGSSARASWGHGYATEAARECLRFAFATLALPEVVSFTATRNRRSRAVMERLGLRYAGEFEHPRLPARHPLRTHVLYRLKRAEWRDASPA